MIELTEQLTEQLGSLVGTATQAELQTLCTVSSAVDLRQNEVLLEEGRESAATFFVIEGSLTASVSGNGETVVLGEIGSGQWIGEVAVLNPGPATATVVAKSDCRLLKLGIDEFEALTKENSVLANGMIRTLCAVLIERLRMTGDMVFSEGVAESKSATEKSVLVKAYRQLLNIREDMS